EIDFVETIPTYGVGLTYDILKRDKYDLARLVLSYTKNDKDFSFLSNDYENNEFVNINARFEAAIGALLLGVEYNNFRDNLRNERLNTIGIIFGVNIRS
ncbi:MAG: hypothetical protein AAFO94_22575, partial [Bacteroidota bacterium]